MEEESNVNRSSTNQPFVESTQLGGSENSCELFENSTELGATKTTWRDKLEAKQGSNDARKDKNSKDYIANRINF